MRACQIVFSKFHHALHSFASTEQLCPQVFDGAKVIIQKGLSKNFQTMHTLTLASATQPAQWQFGATYVGTKKIGDNDVCVCVCVSYMHVHIIFIYIYTHTDTSTHTHPHSSVQYSLET